MDEKSADLMCQASTLLILLNIGLTEGRKITEVDFVVWLNDIRMTVEGSVDLPVITNMFQDILEEHQLGLHAVLIIESSGSLHQSR
jgi:hypothetical protein